MIPIRFEFLKLDHSDFLRISDFDIRILPEGSFPSGTGQ